jgi:hypothetical protein
MPNGVTFAVWMLISDADKLSMAMVACDAHIFIIVVCYVVCVSFLRGPPKIHFSVWYHHAFVLLKLGN